MLHRHPLRDQVDKEIRARLSDGRLAAGTRVNESHLSADLGISRTPLREALLQLEATGFLDSDMGRGFLIPDLLPGRFQDIQAVLARLEPFALGLTMPYPGQRVMELNNLLVRSKLRLGGPGPQTAPTLCELIDGWAGLLLESCPNTLVRQDILRLEALSRRYWFRVAIGGFDPSALVTSLEGMYELVRTGQSARAASHWSEHTLRFSPEAAPCLTSPLPHAAPGR